MKTSRIVVQSVKVWFFKIFLNSYFTTFFGYVRDLK